MQISWLVETLEAKNLLYAVFGFNTLKISVAATCLKRFAASNEGDHNSLRGRRRGGETEETTLAACTAEYRHSTVLYLLDGDFEPGSFRSELNFADGVARN